MVAIFHSLFMAILRSLLPFQQTVKGHTNVSKLAEPCDIGANAAHVRKLHKRSRSLPLMAQESIIGSVFSESIRGQSSIAAFDSGISQTSFRKWVSAPLSCHSAFEDLVPGLRDAFKDAGLASYDHLAEKWCVDNGAAFLYELIDCEGDLCSALGFEMEIRVRLHKTLLAHIINQGVNDTSSGDGGDTSQVRYSGDAKQSFSANSQFKACCREQIAQGQLHGAMTPGMKQAKQLDNSEQKSDAVIKERPLTFATDADARNTRDNSHQTVRCSHW
jgi:hypothetical protein